MTLRRWTILSVILLVPGFVLQFLSRTVFVPEAGVIGGLLLAAGLAAAFSGGGAAALGCGKVEVQTTI